MGVPKKREDKISTWLVKEQTPDGDRMRIAKHGEDGADHAVSFYRIIEQAAQTYAWLEMGALYRPHAPASRPRRPYRPSDSGRPEIFRGRHQLELSGGVQNKLHLHARRIDIPHPSGGRLRITAPLPPHMVQTWNLFGFDLSAAEEDDD
jgi:23S rRNA pseudouridine955/2504/2580 synthase